MNRLSILTLSTMTALFLGIALPASVGTANAQQVLKVGTKSTGAPWSFHDTKSNTDQGIAVELITEIGKDVGFQIQFLPMALTDLIPALNSNKIDIIAANMLITPARQALIDFSDPLYPGGDGLVVLKSDTREYKTLDDLKGAGIGTQSGSPFLPLIQETGLFPSLKIYASGPDVMRAVSAGEIKAGVVGGNLAAYEVKLGNFPNLQIVKSYQPLVTSADAFGVRKTDGDLLKKINMSLTKLKANGTMKTVFAKYGIDWTPPK